MWGNLLCFCLRAFGDGLSLSDLSQVTDIDRMTIQKNLDFLVKAGVCGGKAFSVLQFEPFFSLFF